MLLKSTLVGAAALVALTCSTAADWVGKASYYHVNRRTASELHVGAFTAAHRSLPFGSRIRVTNLANNRSVIVTVTDRGPFIGGREVDVSARAARALGFRSGGVVRVKIELAEAG